MVSGRAVELGGLSGEQTGEHLRRLGPFRHHDVADRSDGEQEEPTAGVVRDCAHDRTNSGVDPFSGVPRCCGDRVERDGCDLLDDVVVHGLHERAPVRETLVEVAARDAGPAAHPSNRQVGLGSSEQIESGLDEDASTVGDSGRTVHAAVGTG